jgi:tRNA 2-thiouridine synthesizing protein A
MANFATPKARRREVLMRRLVFGAVSRQNNAMSRTQLDLKGLKCPLPALKLAKALKALAPGSVIDVACTDPMAAIDIPNLLRETGDILRDKTIADGVMVFTVEKAG